MHKLRNNPISGMTLTELLVGLVILLAAIGAAVLGVQSISRMFASYVVQTRADAIIRDASEALRHRSGMENFLNDAEFMGTYYYPGDTKDVPSVTYSTAPIKVQAEVGSMDVFNRTRPVKITAIYMVGATELKRTRTFTLTSSRITTFGGQVKGRVIDAIRRVGVGGILIMAPGEGGDKVYTRSTNNGDFDLRGVKLGEEIYLTLQGNVRGRTPSYYFRNIDDIDDNLTDSNPASPSGLDEYDVNNSTVSLSFKVRVILGQNSIGIFEMWPFGQVRGNVRVVNPEDLDSNGIPRDVGPASNVIIQVLPLRREILTCGKDLSPCPEEKYSYYPGPKDILTRSDGSFLFDDVVPGIYRIYMHGTGENNPTYMKYEPPDTCRYTQKNYYRKNETGPASRPTPSIFSGVLGFNDYRNFPYGLGTFWDQFVWYSKFLNKKPTRLGGETYAACFELSPGQIYEYNSQADSGNRKVNGEKTTHFQTVPMGDLVGKLRGGRWDGTAGSEGKGKFVEDTNDIPQNFFIYVYWYPYYMRKSDFKYLQSPYYYVLQTEALAGLTAKASTIPDYLDYGTGGYVRLPRWQTYTKYTNNAGEFYWWSIGPHFFEKSLGNAEMFNQRLYFVFSNYQYSASLNQKYSPFFIYDDPQSDLQYFAGLAFNGGDFDTWGTKLGYSLVVIPSTVAFWQDGEIRALRPNYSLQPMFNSNSELERRTLNYPHLLGRKGIDVGTLKVLKRDQLATVSGKIVDTGGNKFVCVGEDFVSTIGMGINGCSLVDMNYRVQVCDNGTDSWFDTSKGGANCSQDVGRRVLPTIRQNMFDHIDPASGLPLKYGYGNERMFTYVCTTAQFDQKNISGKLIARQKLAGGSFHIFSLAEIAPLPLALIQVKYITSVPYYQFVGAEIPVNFLSEEVGSDPLVLNFESVNPVQVSKYHTDYGQTKLYKDIDDPTATDNDRILMPGEPLGGNPPREIEIRVNQENDSYQSLFLGGSNANSDWEDGTKWYLNWYEAGVKYDYDEGTDKYLPGKDPYTQKTRNIEVYRKMHFKKVCAHVSVAGAPSDLPIVKLYVSRNGRNINAMDNYVGSLRADSNGDVCFEDGVVMDVSGVSKTMGPSDRMFVGFPAENIKLVVSPNFQCAEKGLTTKVFHGYDNIEVDAIFELEEEICGAGSGPGDDDRL